VPARSFDTLIFFVTSRCNSLCRTCFYWEDLNSRDDLTIEEIRRLSATMPAFHEVWLSGGEPTLREELADIVELFYRVNGVRSLNYPANGLLPQKLRETLERAYFSSGESLHAGTDSSHRA
jgi:molybdenum cofactor biosynthesis enzyme MoaA